MHAWLRLRWVLGEKSLFGWDRYVVSAPCLEMDFTTTYCNVSDRASFINTYLGTMDVIQHSRYLFRSLVVEREQF